ncbi:GNAT family N-acetyltransferase [Deinococcus roseus]|uniref:GNAT family N-acetyltransferase n=1 Tax=Deinococcus roseus TaxID=392414 RepID=A0ABQ2D470_9DEIO|nr:GNAT family N-acetyltransferase [Deinococcus roseus]GGJ41922.1 GNAT family N-acetyltransferase [Deinococcus roseus]
MLIRQVKPTDTTDILALLDWMDASPHREVFTPEARTPEDLSWEVTSDQGLVLEDEAGSVRAFAALNLYKDGFLLEGPLGDSSDYTRSILRAVLKKAHKPVYAFCSAMNREVRVALEDLGFGTLHCTDFYSMARPNKQRLPFLPDGVKFMPAFRIGFQDYLELYRSSEDVWAERLNWTEEKYRQHFAQENVEMMVLCKDGHPVGFAELEFDEDEATLAYWAVHPAFRGQGYGKLLLQYSIHDAFLKPQIMCLKARAHDHEAGARHLYDALAFRKDRSMMAYLREHHEQA